MSTFRQDLEKSRIFELELTKHIDHDRFEQSSADYAFSEYDIKFFMCDGSIETHEVKVDYISATTGNIAIEYQQFREGIMKKTGISKSKANYYAIFSPKSIHEYELFVIDRKVLKKMINNQEFFDQKKTYDNSYFVLFKKEQIKAKSILYKNIK